MYYSYEALNKQNELNVENINQNESVGLIDSLRKKDGNKKLDKNQAFDTFEEFDSYVQAFFEENYWIMSKSHSDKDKKDGKFVRVQYTCHRAEKIKSESTGERPNQNYYGNDCKCHVYMRYKKRGLGKDKYVITDLNLNHNHNDDLNEKFYSFHPKNRKLDDEQLEEATVMLKNRAKPTFVSNIKEKYGINFVGKDVYNLNQKIFKEEFDLTNVPKDDRDKVALDKIIQQQIKKDGANYFK